MGYSYLGRCPTCNLTSETTSKSWPQWRWTQQIGICIGHVFFWKFSRHLRVNHKNHEIVKKKISLTNFKEKLVSVRNAFFKGIYKPKKGEKRSILRSCGPARVGPMGYGRKHGRVWKWTDVYGARAWIEQNVSSTYPGSVCSKQTYMTKCGPLLRTTGWQVWWKSFASTFRHSTIVPETGGIRSLLKD